MNVQKLSTSVQEGYSLQALRDLVAKPQAEPPWNRLVRRVSIYVTWLLIRTPISANGVTFLFLAAALSGAAAFAVGERWAWLAGTLLIWLSIVFDFSDGEVARFRRESSWFGDYFEETVHAAHLIAMHACIAIGLWQRQPANPWPFVAALVAAGGALIARNDKNLLMKSMFQYYGFDRLRRIAPGFALGEFAPTRNMRGLLYLVDLLVFDLGLYFVALPLAAIADRMDLFLYFYGAVRALSVAYMFAQAWRLRAKYHGREETVSNVKE